MVRGFVDFPKWRKWNCILSNAPIAVRYEVKQTNTRKWLLESVAKSIAKEMLFDDGMEFRNKLLEQINLEYRILTENDDIIDW